jgi:hypothetical protein
LTFAIYVKNNTCKRMKVFVISASHLVLGEEFTRSQGAPRHLTALGKEEPRSRVRGWGGRGGDHS